MKVLKEQQKLVEDLFDHDNFQQLVHLFVLLIQNHSQLSAAKKTDQQSAAAAAAVGIVQQFVALCSSKNVHWFKIKLNAMIECRSVQTTYWCVNNHYYE